MDGCMVKIVSSWGAWHEDAECLAAVAVLIVQTFPGLMELLINKVTYNV